MLKFLYRTASVQFRIAGCGPIEWDDRRMINMDLSHVVGELRLARDRNQGCSVSKKME